MFFAKLSGFFDKNKYFFFLFFFLYISILKKQAAILVLISLSIWPIQLNANRMNGGQPAHPQNSLIEGTFENFKNNFYLAMESMERW